MITHLRHNLQVLVDVDEVGVKDRHLKNGHKGLLPIICVCIGHRGKDVLYK